MTPAYPTLPQHTQLQAINDFVVKFANVNGSGSASANELFAKAILRMGVPVSPRNIFPSRRVCGRQPQPQQRLQLGMRVLPGTGSGAWDRAGYRSGAT